ncbi:MAG: NUDIX domain-containing protein [Oscillospiraceae bacterium]|nr:NUDIX domain-containing protein [Oscillospiraceae bacterium]
MIGNTRTSEVLVQNRTSKYPGWSFPGGHVERGENCYDCAVRKVFVGALRILSVVSRTRKILRSGYFA